MPLAYVNLRRHGAQWTLQVTPVKRFKKPDNNIELTIGELHAEEFAAAGISFTKEDQHRPTFYFTRKELIMALLAVLMIVIALALFITDITKPVNSMTYGY